MFIEEPYGSALRRPLHLGLEDSSRRGYRLVAGKPSVVDRLCYSFGPLPLSDAHAVLAAAMRPFSGATSPWSVGIRLQADITHRCQRLVLRRLDSGCGRDVGAQRVSSGPSTLARTPRISLAREMLVYDFTRIPLPVDQVRHRLFAAVSGLWQQVAEAAYDEGEQLLSRVGPFGPVPGLSKAVSVHVSKSRDRGEGFVVPLRWSATGPTELFPVLEADLEVAPLGAHDSQLRLSGSYDPPLGSIGRQLDRLLLHQLAEATVRAFLSQLVAALLVEPASDVGQTAADVEPAPDVVQTPEVEAQPQVREPERQPEGNRRAASC